MTDTSTYPYGPFRHCHTCGRLVSADPSSPGDAPCPHCGCLLWFNTRFGRALPFALASLGGSAEWDEETRGWNVDLSGRVVTSESLQLIRRLKSVVELHLTDTCTDDAMIWRLEGMHTVEVLELNNSNITDASLALIGTFPRLEVLGLSDTGITDEGLTELKSLARLWCLDVEGTAVSDVGLLQIAELNGLEILHLARTRVSDESIDAISSLHKLEELDVSNTSMTSDGVARLRRQLPFCEIRAY